MCDNPTYNYQIILEIHYTLKNLIWSKNRNLSLVSLLKSLHITSLSSLILGRSPKWMFMEIIYQVFPHEPETDLIFHNRAIVKLATMEARWEIWLSSSKGQERHRRKWVFINQQILLPCNSPHIINWVMPFHKNQKQGHKVNLDIRELNKDQKESMMVTKCIILMITRVIMNFVDISWTNLH